LTHYEIPGDKKALELEDKILIMGSPNVGKSVFFSEYTNIHVNSSNYAGTTVSYTHGKIEIGDKSYNLIDVPGTYSLTASSEAESVAIQFLKSRPRAIMFILNAADLTGSIKLLLDVMEYNIPTVVALNLVDVAERKGQEISAESLEDKLGLPVIPTVAVKRKGLDELLAKVGEILATEKETVEDVVTKTAVAAEADSVEETNVAETTDDVDEAKSLIDRQRWQKAADIVAYCVRDTDADPSRLDRFGDLLLKPWPGVLFAVLIVLASLGIIVGVGEALRSIALLPLVNQVIVPFFEKIILRLNLSDILHNVLIGEYGIFRISFEWIIALILPYVLLFQLVFSFLEDSGILPRLAVLFDNLMRKLGIQGGSLISIMLGFGCSVPAIIGTRTATTRKERLVVTAIICFSIPCISQTGALVSLLSSYSYWLLLAVLLTDVIIFIVAAKISSKLIKGHIDPLLIEVPNLLMPDRRTYFKKFGMRMKAFLVEAEGPMLIAVFVAALLAETGLLNGVSGFLKPLVSDWLGLPEEAALSLILGIIRREMSVAPLLSMNLTGLQMFVGAVVSLLYIPCLSVFGIVTKKFNLKVGLAITAGTVVTAILVGGILNHTIRLLMLVF